MELAPLFEFFNHKHRPNCHFSNIYNDDKSFEIRVTSARNIRIGEELFISYVSNQKNVNFLATYGFTDPENVQPLEITMAELEKVCLEVSRRDQEECSQIMYEVMKAMINMSSTANMRVG